GGGGGGGDGRCSLLACHVDSLIREAPRQLRGSTGFRNLAIVRDSTSLQSIHQTVAACNPSVCLHADYQPHFYEFSL
ncbi:hypothetical protein, partial [Mesorhizobium sp. CA4]|uniref:hypothetical protein n=1 Tax=Mesorhizobium sp. CA4 TaxID=588499 RepID=UPI001CD09344